MAKVVSLFSALVIAAGFSLSSQAASSETSLAPAKLVVYRAEESSKTRRINLNAMIGTERLGRVKYNRPVVTTVAPGEYTLGSNVSGTKGAVVDLKPGQTYFVHMQLKRLGQTVTPTMIIVEEQVAMDHLPEDTAGTI